MTDTNSVVIAGRLTRDSEGKYTKGGMAIAEMSVASNRSIKKGDQWQDEASFFDCIMFGKRAEKLGEYLTKGTQVIIQGQLKQDRWEKDGQKRSKINIVVDNIQLVGGRKSGGEAGQAKESFEENIPF
jgi:single-strand DNA-binding protein